MNSLKLVWFILQNADEISGQVQQLIQFVQDMLDRYRDGDVPAPVGDVDFDQAYPLLCTAAVTCNGVEGVGDRLGFLKAVAEWIKANPDAAALLLQMLRSLVG